MLLKYFINHIWLSQIFHMRESYGQVEYARLLYEKF